MSMILLEPANTILQTSGEDQAADHLINGVSGNFAERPTFQYLKLSPSTDGSPTSSRRQFTKAEDRIKAWYCSGQRLAKASTFSSSRVSTVPGSQWTLNIPSSGASNDVKQSIQAFMFLP
jgi:hypothetical protein